MDNVFDWVIIFARLNSGHLRHDAGTLSRVHGQCVREPACGRSTSPRRSPSSIPLPQAGLAVELVWVGVKMMLLIGDVKIPTPASLAVVLLILAVSVLVSTYATRRGVVAAEQLGDDDTDHTSATSRIKN